MSDDWVLDDNGNWVLRMNRQKEMERKGILYGDFGRGKTMAEKAVINPSDLSKYKYEPEESNIYLPYLGFDVAKFPKTYMTLIMMYHMPDWYQGSVIVNRPYPDFTKTRVTSATQETATQETQEAYDYDPYP